MNNQQKKPQHELVKLEPMDMHGPVEVTIAIHVMVPSLGKRRLSFRMPPGVIPTRAEIMEVYDACLSPDAMQASGIPTGTRVMSKPEFVAHVTERESGSAMPMPGSQEYVRPDSEIPKQVLIDAICGRGFPSMEDAESWTKAGMAKETGDQHNYKWEWDREALKDLTNTELWNIYRRG